MSIFGEHPDDELDEHPFVPTPDPPPEEDDPDESFASMNEEIAAAPTQTEVGTTVLPCGARVPWLELTIYKDGHNQPAAGAPYSLTTPGSGKHEGHLDGSGRVRIEDEELDVNKVEAVVSVELDDKGEVKRYIVSLEAKAREVTEDAPAEQDHVEAQELTWTDFDPRQPEPEDWRSPAPPNGS